MKSNNQLKEYPSYLIIPSKGIVCSSFSLDLR